MKQVPIGVIEYEELKKSNYYAVDKTLMIKEFLERQNKVTLVTRPRRFGKTLNMSMMANFFDITKDSKKLFKDTKIMNTKYTSELNQWPTVFISFASVSGNLNKMVDDIKLILRKEYNRYSFIFTKLSDLDEFEYNKVLNVLKNDENNLNYVDKALSFLIETMEKYYHKKVMLFIDEYDTPFIEAHVNGYYQEVSNSLSSLLHNSLKLSSSLQHAFVTGIQRVAKESIFSKLNNPVVCTMNDKRYSQYFGFTEDETKELLEYYGLALNHDVKDMYDGYHIGNLEIYNPWSIVNYADTHELIPYWINTSANTMIKNAMSQCEPSFKNGYETLIEHGYLDTQVLMETSFYEQAEAQSLWGLFINAGYLTIDQHIEDDFYCIRIPNQEVQKEFKSLTAHYLQVSSLELENLYFALRNNKEKMFKDSYQRLLKSLPSSHDLKDENSYHMMVLGLCAGLSNFYEIKSNREAGTGRCDIILKAKYHHPSYVLEFKYLKVNNQQEVEQDKLDKLADEALEQITKREYDYELTGKVIHIALAHQGKIVSVKWHEKQHKKKLES